MKRGEIWLAQIGRKKRPVIVLTRSAVIDARSMVTIAEITTSARGLSVEVPIDPVDTGIDRPSVINCDGLHTVAQSMLRSQVGLVDDETLSRVCSAMNYALGC